MEQTVEQALVQALDADRLLEQLKQTPQLPRYYQEIGQLLADEAQRRQQFYEDITEDDKAEFINGEVIFHSPAKYRHGEAGTNLLMLMRVYAQHYQLGKATHEKMLVSLTRNDYEPDICYFAAEKAAQFTPDQMRFPVPDLIVEVLSPSTATHDRGVKFEDYAAHGVGEYWLIDPESETVEQYVLEGGRYSLRLKAQDGTIASQVLAGFRIPIRAIFDSDEQLATLQRLLVP